MSRICLEAEACIDYPVLYRAICSSVPTPVSTEEAICSAAVETAESLGANVIIALTETGLTARLMSKYRAPQQTVAITTSLGVARQLLLHRGLIPELVPSFRGSDTIVKMFMDQAKQSKMLASGDLCVVVHGMSEETPGRTNLLKVVPVP